MMTFSIQMQNASRGWFEDESVFQQMCDSEQKEARKKYQSKMSAGKSKNVNKKSGGIGGGTSSRASASSGWTSAAPARGGSRTSSSSAAPKKSGFSAAFAGGSDSDSDD